MAVGVTDDDKQHLIDANDFANELAGLDAGRQERFMVGAQRDSGDEGEQRRERDSVTLLQQLLRNPEYARLYDAARSALDSAQRALDAAIIANAEAQDRLTQTVEDMESKAATLEDGTKVFRSADGNLYTADGRRLSAEEAAGVNVPDDAPSYEAYTQAQDALRRAKEKGRDLSDIQTTILDPARRRLEDENNPPSEDELRDLIPKLQGVPSDIERTRATAEFGAAAAEQEIAEIEPVLDQSELDAIPTFRV